jgi:hypothetical protein
MTKTVGQDTQGASFPGSQGQRPVLHTARKNASKKAVTPGYKALLVPEQVFHRLQIVQAGLAHPRRLSVADLCAACVALACDQHTAQEVIARASKIVAESLTPHVTKEVK